MRFLLIICFIFASANCIFSNNINEIDIETLFANAENNVIDEDYEKALEYFNKIPKDIKWSDRSYSDYVSTLIELHHYDKARDLINKYINDFGKRSLNYRTFRELIIEIDDIEKEYLEELKEIERRNQNRKQAQKKLIREQKYIERKNALKLLWKGAVSGDILKLKKAMKTDIDINYQFPESGMTALHLTCEYRDYSHLKVLEFLLKNDAKLNIKDKRGITPLLFSIIHSNIEAVTALLKNGADPSLVFNHKGKYYNALSLAKLIRSEKAPTKKIKKARKEVYRIVKSMAK